MQGMCLRSATFASVRDGGFSELFRRGSKRRLHSGARFGNLHAPEQSIEFAVESVEPRLSGTRERAVLLHRKQDCLGSLVPGDQYHATLNDAVEDFSKFVLGFGRADLDRHLAPAIANHALL